MAKIQEWTAHQKILVEPENSEDVEKVWEWLNANDVLIEGEWIDIYNNAYIEGTEKVKVIYEPEVRYLKNGDGNPAIWELEGGVEEDWLKDKIMEELGVDCVVCCSLEDID